MFNPAEIKIQLPPPPAALRVATSLQLKIVSVGKSLEQNEGVVLPFLLSREILEQELGLGNLL